MCFPRLAKGNARSGSMLDFNTIISSLSWCSAHDGGSNDSSKGERGELHVAIRGKVGGKTSRQEKKRTMVMGKRTKIQRFDETKTFPHHLSSVPFAKDGPLGYSSPCISHGEKESSMELRRRSWAGDTTTTISCMEELWYKNSIPSHKSYWNVFKSFSFKILKWSI